MALTVLTVLGSRRPDAKIRQLAALANGAAEAAGARVTTLDLAEVELPVMHWGDERQRSDATIARVRALAAEADAFLLATPEYHGSMSGALKNWFDFLYPELAGKLCGVLVTVGGAGGTGDMSATAVRNSASWCHAFTLPYHVTASERDFGEGALTNDRVVDRLHRLGHDLVRYGTSLRSAFTEALHEARTGGAPSDAASRRHGMAGWHT
jgi:FMN reductase